MQGLKRASKFSTQMNDSMGLFNSDRAAIYCNGQAVAGEDKLPRKCLFHNSCFCIMMLLSVAPDLKVSELTALNLLTRLFGGFPIILFSSFIFERTYRSCDSKLEFVQNDKEALPSRLDCNQKAYHLSLTAMSIMSYVTPML